MTEIITILVNVSVDEVNKENMENEFGTTATKILTHEVAKDLKVTHIPASCQRILNEIEDLIDKHGVEYYNGLKVVINHTDLVALHYLVKELKKRSVRVFDRNLREFI